MSEELNDELARKLYAAWMSERLGISLAYAYSRHAVGKKMGAVWLGLASYLRETASSTFAQSLAPREGTE